MDKVVIKQETNEIESESYLDMDSGIYNLKGY